MNKKLWTSSRKLRRRKGHEQVRVYSWWRGRSLLLRIALQDGTLLDHTFDMPIEAADGTRYHFAAAYNGQAVFGSPGELIPGGPLRWHE